ncbi:MAG: hypothetical protein U1F48_05580 [Burkholderiales bacterium]
MTGDWKAEAQALERRGDMSGANERVVGAGHEGHSEAYVELASILSQRGLNDEAQRALDAAEAVAREDDVTTHFGLNLAYLSGVGTLAYAEQRRRAFKLLRSSRSGVDRSIAEYFDIPNHVD